VVKELGLFECNHGCGLSLQTREDQHVPCGIAGAFIGKLKSTPERDGTPLDHSMMVYGGGLSDNNRHLHENLPVLLFGEGYGASKTGRHVVYEKAAPITNLYLSLKDRMGVSPERLGSDDKPEHLVGSR
jgi:hypothetical protein